jgi:hypothetical protein
VGLSQAAAGEDILALEARPALDYQGEEKSRSRVPHASATLRGAIVLAEAAAGENLLARKPARIIGSEEDSN